MNSSVTTVSHSPAPNGNGNQPATPEIPFNRKNRNVYVSINGRMIHRRRARISPFDAVVQAGDGVWEEMRLYEGHVYKLVDHINRLRHGAEQLGFKEIPSRPWLIGQVKRALLDNNMYDGVHVHLVMTRGIKVTAGTDPILNKYGPTVLIICEYKNAAEYALPVKLIVSPYKRVPAECGDPEIRHTGLAPNLLAKMDAQRKGADDALLLDLNDKVTEATMSSFFYVRGGTVHVSPPVSNGEKMCRDGVVELCKRLEIKCEEKAFGVKDLAKAEEMFLADTLREITPVVALDGNAVGTGEPGEITTKIAAHWRPFAAEVGTKLITPEDIDFDDEWEDDEYED